MNQVENLDSDENYLKIKRIFAEVYRETTSMELKEGNLAQQLRGYKLSPGELKRNILQLAAEKLGIPVPTSNIITLDNACTALYLEYQLKTQNPDENTNSTLESQL